MLSQVYNSVLIVIVVITQCRGAVRTSSRCGCRHRTDCRADQAAVLLYTLYTVYTVYTGADRPVRHSPARVVLLIPRGGAALQCCSPAGCSNAVDVNSFYWQGFKRHYLYVVHFSSSACNRKGAPVSDFNCCSRPVHALLQRAAPCILHFVCLQSELSAATV